MKVYTICSGFCTLLSVSEAKKHGATYIIKLWKTRCVLEILETTVVVSQILCGSVGRAVDYSACQCVSGTP